MPLKETRVMAHHKGPQRKHHIQSEAEAGRRGNLDQCFDLGFYGKGKAKQNN